MRLFKRSNGYYYIKIFDEFGNEIRRISTGKRKKADALKKLSTLKERLKEERRTKPITLGTFRNQYTDYAKATKSKGYNNSVRSAFRFLQSVYKDETRIQDIDPEKVESALIELSQPSPHAAYTYLRVFATSFNRAVQLNYLFENPFKRIRVPKPAEKENLYITSIEFDKILSNEPSKLLKDIYSFAYYTGMRISEITNTQVSWIDLNELTITVQNSDTFRTKNKKSRIIPINDKVLEVIQRNLPKIVSMRKTDYLFRKNQCRINSEYISKKFKKAVRKTFGKNTAIHFHNLRGSFGSELIKKGVNPIHVQKRKMLLLSMKIQEKKWLKLSKQQ